MRPIHLFSDEYLVRCSSMSPDEILDFMEDCRLTATGQDERSRLISMKVPENLLRAFRRRAELEGQRYQTQIKRLMREWLEG